MAPLTEAEIDEVERALRLPLPPEARDKYRESDGFLGPTGCALLYLRADIVRANALRREAWFPQAFAEVVIVGDDGCGNLVAHNWRTREAILWNPADGEAVQERRSTVAEIWARIEEMYADTP